MKKFFAGLGVIVLIMGVAFVSSGSIRDFTYEIFNAQAFTDLRDTVDTINTNVADLGGGKNYDVELAALEAKIDALMKTEATLFFADTAGVEISQLVVGQGTPFSVQAIIKGETLKEISAVGFHLLFDDTTLRLDSMDRGEFTLDWGGMDYNIGTPGDATVGGFAGSGRLIAGPGIGVLCTFNFTAIASGNVSVTATGLLDDLIDFQPQTIAVAVLVQ